MVPTDLQAQPGAGCPVPARFERADRLLLLRMPGIGPGVIRRLEAAGVVSLGDLAARGVDEVVANICAQLRTPAWGNRRAALGRALSSSGSSADA